MSEYIVGIDLGTTNSVAAIFRDGKAEVLKNNLGEFLTPSVVAYDKKNDTLVTGRIAKDILALEPENGAANFKRHMGEDYLYTINKKKYGAVELSACILKTIKAQVESLVGESVNNAVITVPAYFDEKQRFATIKAGEIAGFKVDRIINEPTAAAIAYGLNKREAESTFLVFDLGGGTFDVCIMELFEGMLEVRSTAGASMLGGEDFTNRLMSYILEKVNVNFEYIEMKDPKNVMLLRKRCEIAKRKLSDAEVVSITIPQMGKMSEDAVIDVTSEESATIFKPLLDRIYRPCRTVLRGAEIEIDEIDEVILVGGATRMPCIRKFVDTIFSRAPLTTIDPDLAVAEGASVQGALHNDDEAVKDWVVTDVASHTMGVNIAKKMGSNNVSGYFSPIIHRNTVIPVSETQDYVTSVHNQTEMEFKIFEGESRYTKDNRLIGDIQINKIPKDQKGEQVINVTFTYDTNGILEVEVQIAKTGKKFNKIFTHNVKDLSQEELAKAKKRIKELKVNPYKKPHFRELLARADLMYQDVHGQQKEILGGLIDRYEAALKSHTPTTIDDTYEELKDYCDSLDGGMRW